MSSLQHAEKLDNATTSDHVRNSHGLLEKTFRSETNFLKTNREIGISHPSDYPPEYEPLSFISTFDLIKTVYHIFRYDVYTRIAVLKCLVMSTCVSIASTFIAMLHKYENRRMEVCDGEINVNEDTALMFKQRMDYFYDWRPSSSY
jgi:hypothetical protein